MFSKSWPLYLSLTIFCLLRPLIGHYCFSNPKWTKINFVFFILSFQPQCIKKSRTGFLYAGLRILADFPERLFA